MENYISSKSIIAWEDYQPHVLTMFLTSFVCRAFKVYNEGTAFFFKCKTEAEAIEWINHLSLAAIGFDTKQVDLSIANSASTGI